MEKYKNNKYIYQKMGVKHILAELENRFQNFRILKIQYSRKCEGRLLC